MVREKSEKIEDGADEGMLAANEKEQLARKDEVKFISGDHNINGDAKIDIGAIEKVRERDVIRFAANFISESSKHSVLIVLIVADERFPAAHGTQFSTYLRNFAVVLDERVSVDNLAQ